MALCVFGFMFLGLFIPWKDKDRYALRRLWLKYIFIPFGNIKITTSGNNNYNQPSLYVSNHRSIADIFLYKYVDAKIVAKAEIANYPIINKVGESTGVIWVKRENRKSRSHTLMAMKNYIQDGVNIHLFPEGTTWDNYHTKPFNKGTFKLAAKVGVPIAPVVIEYRDMKKAWVEESIFAHFVDVFSTWKTEIKIHFGEPMNGADGDLLAQEVEDYFNNQLHEMQVGWSKSFPLGRDTHSTVYPRQV